MKKMVLSLSVSPTRCTFIHLAGGLTGAAYECSNVDRRGKHLWNHEIVRIMQKDKSFFGIVLGLKLIYEVSSSESFWSS